MTILEIALRAALEQGWKVEFEFSLDERVFEVTIETDPGLAGVEKSVKSRSLEIALADCIERVTHSSAKWREFKVIVGDLRRDCLTRALRPSNE